MLTFFNKLYGFTSLILGPYVQIMTVTEFNLITLSLLGTEAEHGAVQGLSKPTVVIGKLWQILYFWLDTDMPADAFRQIFEHPYIFISVRIKGPLIAQ